MKTKTCILFLMSVFAGSYLTAQSLTPFVISSSGGYFSSATGSLSSTVAEMTMVQTFMSTGNYLTQGFQQPEEWYTSVNEEQAPGNFIVSPNPNAGSFDFIVHSSAEGSAGICIYDLLGQKIWAQHMNIVSGQTTWKIDISGYTNGIYLLEYLYSGDDGKKETKIFKINLIK
ncbi:MAG TPA: T9SS type A sorting domain-containing protein [Bacteroidales bacterium]|nr:T9SS type A sorting domain-containing protein [Bacteroidales bacterium]HNZ43328.1 T9SS type A sorting domain-containing protein [Bacteroidales bacterium]HPB26043.1 T9SS type A sorting domain-containing protein [Bacteroidales bacterium]HPI31359.1 T9SS type A sorting domain-containing protein [Bacteroidales bacterium]HQN17033.1 T9SS type A sorting domain-containing protein [Bacteroidales bacterium]